AFKRENHYRLQSDAEAPLDSLDHALALRQLGGGTGNHTMIDVAAQPMPYETGRKFFHRFEVTAAGVGMAGCPGEIRMRSRAEMVDMTEKGGQGCSVEMIEIHRPVVDHEVERRQPCWFYAGRAIGRDEDR